MRLAVHARRAVILAACLAPRMASAQEDAENRATARALAEQGAAALEAKDYPKAEDAFKRANALFHAPTLLLGLARAQAAEGKFVEAWESYNQVILDNNTTTPVFQKALDDAKKEIATVDGRRSHVTVTVTGAAAPRVTLDESALRPEALGVPFFVNPGNHTLAVAADGFNPATRTFSVAEGQATTVAIALEPTAHVAVAPPPPPVVVAPPPPPPRHVSHVPAFVAFGVGGAGLVLGVAEGLVALSKHGTLKKDCPTSTNCAPSEQSTIDAYHVAAAVSTVGFIVAGLGAATGITLFVVENKSAAAASSGVAVSPYIGLGEAGLSGRF